MDEASALRLLVSGHSDARALGFADDAAVVSFSGQTVISQDMLVEDVDFRRETFSPEDVGHKALAVNLSDLAAMGAVPLGFMQADFELSAPIAPTNNAAGRRGPAL